VFLLIRRWEAYDDPRSTSRRGRENAEVGEAESGNR